STQTVLTATCPPGAGGPYPPTTWPTNINPILLVHYWTVDPTLPQPNPNWNNCLGLVTGGDQATADVTYQGLAGKQATQPNLNIYDQNWQNWNTNGLIDILLSVYGDGNMLRSATDPNQCRRFQFLTGTLPTDSFSTVYGNNQIATTAAPSVKDTRQTFVPGTLNNTREFYITMTVTDGLTKYTQWKRASLPFLPLKP